MTAILNGLSPNASEYSQTIPYFICTEAGNQCVNKCATNDNSCQSACRAQHPCGAQDPKRVNTSTISTMIATKTGSGAASTNKDAVYTTYGGAAATASAAAGSAAAAAALQLGQSYGVSVLAAGLFAGFGLMI
ncbi:MAG: hypothetical protein M1812_003119 [Candelaria pacifica]|nr:MAG: hypothetical protein M1812_003119 [Candelaria pacifica]